MTGTSMRLAVLAALAPLIAFDAAGAGAISTGTEAEAAARSDPGRSSPVDEMFGFQVGEERRYKGGPPERLKIGEREDWSIRLVAVGADAEGRQVARFSLRFESTRFRSGANLMGGDAALNEVSETNLWVNDQGFPLRIDYEARKSSEQPSYQRLRVEFAEDRFVFSSDTTMYYRRLEMHLPTDGFTDLSVPEGFFVAKEINPGLLSIPYAVLGSAPDNDQRYRSFDFRPMAEADYEPPSRSAWQRSRSGASGDLFDRAPTPMYPQFRRRELRIPEPAEVQLDDRTVMASRVRVGGSRSDADHWFAADGTLMRIDFPKNIRGASWIMLVPPGQY